MLERHRGAIAGEITIEERPQHRVARYPVVQPIDERLDCFPATDASQDAAAGEGAVRLRVGKETTVLHQSLVSVGLRVDKSATHSLCSKQEEKMIHKRRLALKRANAREGDRSAGDRDERLLADQSFHRA